MLKKEKKTQYFVLFNQTDKEMLQVNFAPCCAKKKKPGTKFAGKVASLDTCVGSYWAKCNLSITFDNELFRWDKRV